MPLCSYVCVCLCIDRCSSRKYLFIHLDVFIKLAKVPSSLFKANVLRIAEIVVLM